MTWADYDIVGSFNTERYPNIDSERTINMFEYLDEKDKKPKTLLPTSGLVNTNVEFFNGVTHATGEFRAQFVFDDSMYCVIGTEIYRVSGPNLSVVAFLGDIGGTGVGYVGVSANTFQVIFVDGLTGWIFDTDTNILTQITDSAFPGRPIDVTYLDGFFVVADGETNNFYLSEFNQGLIWGNISETFTIVGPPTTLLTVGSTGNLQVGLPIRVSSDNTLPTPLQADTTYFIVAIPGATTLEISATKGGVPINITDAGVGTHTLTNNGQLQVGSITSNPGNIVACRVLHRRLFLFSEFYTEVWENAGIGSNLPFRRNNSLLLEYGTPAIGSIAVGLDTMYFLSQDQNGQGSVMMIAGAQSIPVSTKEVDYDIAQFAQAEQVSDARGILIKENGLIFYRLNFTEADETFVLNVNMSQPGTAFRWHEEQVLNGNRHPAQTQAFFEGKNYYGDYQAPILYEVDDQVTTNAGEPIPRIRIGRPVTPPEYKRLRIDRFQLDLVQGYPLEISRVFDFVEADVDTVNDTISVPVGFGVDTGSELVFSTLNTLPSPLVAGTTYFYIYVSDTKFRVADTKTDAFNGIFIDLTTQGSAPNSVQIVSESFDNPEVFLSVSKDGGNSFGNKLISTMGKIGERTFRTVWRKLGTIPRGQGFVPKIEFFNQTPFVILGAAWVFEELPE